MTEGSFGEESGGSRILLRTLQVELTPKVQDYTDKVNEDLERGDSASNNTGHLLPENPVTKDCRRLRVLIYVHRPFMFAFLFEQRTSSLSYSGLYKSLHTTLAPIHKRLLSSTSPETVAQRIDALLAARLIVEGEGGPATGGRRSKSLRFNTEHSHVVAATVDTTHTRVAVADLTGRVVVDDRVDVAVASGPQRTLDAISSTVHALLEKAEVPLTAVSGLGISVPGPIDPDSGRPSQPPIMPGWDAYPIADHLGGALPIHPVLAANDADAAALGEHTVGYPEARALCLVKVSTGIGTGIVIDGRTYLGADGGAGDVGHVRLSDHAEARCQCGAQGCLAAVASGGAVARRLRDLGLEDLVLTYLAEPSSASLPGPARLGLEMTS